MTPPPEEVLREQLLARPAGASLVFPAPGGGMWRSENFMERVFRKAALRAGLGERDQEGHYSGVTFHDLRHTFASLMIAAGVNAKALSSYMTLDRYGHLMPGRRGAGRRAARRLPRAGVRWRRHGDHRPEEHR